MKSPPTKFAFAFRFLFLLFAQVNRAEKGKRERAQNADAQGNDDIWVTTNLLTELGNRN